MSRSKLLLIQKENKIWSLQMSGDRLSEVNVYGKGGSLLHNIYVAKVKNVVKNLSAAFVEIGDARTCFLPLSDGKPPILTNRVYDGRLVSGDEVLVQVIKEAVKTKDPVVSAGLSFAGRYAAINLGESGIHFSTKISGEIKEKIRSAMESFRPEADLPFPYSIVIRTNAALLADDFSELKEEIQTLAAQAADVLHKGKCRTCFSLLYQEPKPYLTEIRDRGGDGFDEIITDDADIFQSVKSYLNENRSAEAEKLRLYKDERLPLSALYGLSAKIDEALDQKVWLKSGGYLVIEPTEALTVIDVNTGKFAGKKSVEDAFYLINREAAEEIARQLRLRNLSGIILVDFINMADSARRTEIMNYLRSKVQDDPVKTVVVDMTPLGLVEMTRKKVRKTLAEQLAEK